MKKAILLIVWTVFISCAAVAQPAVTAFHGISAPKVDRRLELVTIVARLAGLREFQSELVPPYTDSVDAWFAPLSRASGRPTHAPVASDQTVGL